MYENIAYLMAVLKWIIQQLVALLYSFFLVDILKGK
jgi:hypothetical protein